MGLLSNVGSNSTKAMQTTMLVSRQHTDGNGCGKEVVIYYSLLSCEKSIDGKTSLV